MKTYNLLSIAFLIGIAPFIDSLDRGIELVNSVAPKKAVLSQNVRQTPQYLDAEESLQSRETTTILSME